MLPVVFDDYLLSATRPKRVREPLSAISVFNPGKSKKEQAAAHIVETVDDCLAETQFFSSSAAVFLGSEEKE